MTFCFYKVLAGTKQLDLFQQGDSASLERLLTSQLTVTENLLQLRKIVQTDGMFTVGCDRPLTIICESLLDVNGVISMTAMTNAFEFMEGKQYLHKFLQHIYSLGKALGRYFIIFFFC